MTRFASRCAISAAALIVLAGSALAQAPAQPSASHLAIAREAVMNSGMGRSFDTITEPLLAQLQQMNVTRPEIKKDLDQVVEVLKPEMELQKQQMVAAAAKVYARIMTEAELKELNAFFKSPVGLKYVQTQPQALDDIVKEMANWSQTLAEYIMIRARAEMSIRGHQLQ
jgi:hypothetical protein